MTPAAAVLAAVFAAALGTMLGPVPAAAAAGAFADWPQWGGVDRSFVAPRGSDAPALAASWAPAGPPIRWQATLGPGHSGVTVRDGVVYTAFRDGDHDVVIALDASDGHERWRHRVHAPALDFMIPRYGPGPHSTPLVTATSVFLAGSTGHLVALDRTTGARRWLVRLWDDLDGTRLERGYAASPLAFEDTIILPVGGAGRAVVAFRQSDGVVVWKRHDFTAAYASPVRLDVRGRTHLCMLLQDTLVGLDPRRGDLLWRTPINGRRYAICATPVTGPGPRLLTVSGSGAEMHRIDPDGEGGYRVEREWRSRRLGSQDHNLLRAGDRFVGSSSSTTMSVLDARSGEALIRSRENADASVLLVGDLLVSISEEGELVISRLEDDAIVTLARKKILGSRCWSAPALSGTTLYVRDLERLVAVELGAG